MYLQGKERQVRKMIKKFFQITENKYVFNIFDLTALFTICNVVFVILGFWWAPIFGLINCFIISCMQIKNGAYVNAYVTQVALIILNIYFLKI